MVLSLNRWHNEKYLIKYILDLILSVSVNPFETVIITGFWRSGTTTMQRSLADIMSAKTIIEPLEYKKVPGIKKIYPEKLLREKDYEYFHIFMPYFKNSSHDVVVTSYIFNFLKGRTKGRWVRHLSGFRVRFSRRVVVKLVRGQLLLPKIQTDFSNPIVHIYRDPRGVIASLKRSGWIEWFNKTTISEQLLEPLDGRAAYFSKWSDDIKKLDRKGAISKAACYYALTERFVKENLNRDNNFLYISYDHDFKDKEGLLQKIRKLLNLNADISNMNLDDQWTTMNGRSNLSIEKRIISWSKELTSSEIVQIESIMRLFNLTKRLVDH